MVADATVEAVCQDFIERLDACRLDTNTEIEIALSLLCILLHCVEDPEAQDLYIQASHIAVDAVLDDPED
jgi:hypothetical protein